MDERVERRLAAILAADIVGYSRLMGDDEEGTLARLKSAQQDVVDPAIATHRGRLIKTTGDGMLVEFASVIDAVRCAADIQRAMAARAGPEPEPRRLRYRIGINVGDVIVDGGDIYGDGVNVAARLEALAEPGGICLSRAAHDHVYGRLDLDIEDLGELRVKNIALPVHAFRIRLDGAPLASRAPGSWPTAAARRTVRARAIAGALAVLSAAAAAGWWGWHAPDRAPEARPRDAAPAPKRLSIVVLPFTNLSDDQQQGWFADGITDDLITDLSRISGAFVIARNTSFTYRGRTIDTRDVARELGVRYVLEGSVRRDGSQVRVNAQLIDAETAAHVWAERFDRELRDVFALQNEITGRIARALNLELLEAESRRGQTAGATGTDAHDLALKAWIVLLNKPQTPETNLEGEALARQALALDPESALGWTALCYVHTRAGSFGWSASREDSLRLAVEAGERAVRLDPKSSDAVYMLGYALRTSGQNERSMQAMEQAIALNPNNPLPYHGLAYSQILLGRPEAAQALLDRAFQLSPREPLGAVWHWTAGFARLLLGDDAGAVNAARRAIAVNPRFPSSYWVLAAASAHRGDAAASRAALDEFLKIAGGLDTVGRLRAWMAGLSANAAYQVQLERMVAGLRLAGMPE